MLNFIPHKIKVVKIMKKITVTNIDISISVRPDNNDYICLTDMAHFKDRERTNYIIQTLYKTGCVYVVRLIFLGYGKN